MSVNARIKQRFDYLSNWIQNDIVLLQGELAVVDCGSQIRFKIGDGAKSFTQLPFTDQSQLSTKWLAAEAVSQGIHAASIPYGFAAGAYLCADASFSQVLGYDAKALSSDTYSFTWSGDDTRAIGDYYTSHGKGSFSINPLSGLSGVYIGDQRLDQVLADNRGSKISVDGVKADLNIEHLSLSDYMEREASGQLLSNELYIVSTDTFDALGKQVKNMAPGTDLSDAVNFEQLTEVSSRAYDTYTQSEVDQKIANAQYFKKYVVQTLPPVADADERGIYLVPSTDSQLSNTYDEYVVVGEDSSKAWEKIGAKSIDLSGYKTKQTAKTDPTASDSATAFIDTISQDENGVITATKKNVQAASTSLAGIVQLNNTLTSNATNQAATANAVKTVNDKFADYSLTSHVHDQYLTAVPSDYKTYAQTEQSLSTDGYATQEQLNEKSAVSVDNIKTDVNMVHISLDDYNEKLVGGEILSNELYVISADYVETYGQQIKNVAPGTDLSDAVNYSQLLSGLGTKQPAGNYLTAIPSTYKTYAATLSSLSSTYSLTSHTHSQYLTAVPSTYKTYVDTKTQLGTDGFKTYAATLSSLSSTYSLTSHTHTGYVPTSRTVAGQQLTADVTAATISSAIGLGNYALDISALHKTGDETAAGKKTFSDAFTVGTRSSGSVVGTKSFAYGANNTASGEGSFAGGQNSIANAYGAHAEGYGVSATGYMSHAIGQGTLASGYTSYAEGYCTKATYGQTHAEGAGTVAAGQNSHAENSQTSAIGNNSHSEGYETIAQNDNEHAQGAHNFSNVGNQLSSKTLDSVGIGDHTSRRKNATEVMQNGDAYFLGVGGYDGTNAVLATSKPLAAVLSAKADVDSLGYTLSTATGTLSSGSYVYDVADRTITTIGINQSSTPVIVRLPAASTYARDFIVRIEISSAAAPSFTFTNTDGLTFESEDDDWAVMEPGLNIVSFTETKR